MHFPRRDICIYLWSRNNQLQKLENYSLPCMTTTEEKQVKKNDAYTLEKLYHAIPGII